MKLLTRFLPLIVGTLALSSFFAPAVLAADGDAPRKIVSQSSPVYPELARQMRIRGAITMLVTVLPNGHVDAVRIESGHPLLQHAAEDAVRRWRFATGPETTSMTVKVEFQLPD